MNSYLIWCAEHTRGGDACLWWRPNRHGYTTDVAEAGRYTEEEAIGIYRIRNGDVPVPEAAIGTKLISTETVTVTKGVRGQAVVEVYPHGNRSMLQVLDLKARIRIRRPAERLVAPLPA